MAATLRSNRPNSMARAGRWVALALALCVAGCGDDPFIIRWEVNPDTASLFSLSVPDLDLPSAYNFPQRTAVRVERVGASTQFDLALDTRGGELVFLPPGALGIESRARIAELPGLSFQELKVAPSDTLLYSADDPIPVRLNSSYVVRSDPRSGGVQSCSYFAKLEPLAVDPAAGSVRFQFDVSPVCNDRGLVPPDSL